MTRFCAMALAVVVLLGGCGYRFEGSVNTLPRDIRRIAIPAVDNPTNYTVLTNELSNELIRLFTRSDFVKITDSDVADAVLQVKIRSVRIEGGASIETRTGRESLSRRATAVISASLAKRNGEVLWQSQQVVGRRSYSVSSDDQTLVESNLNAALRTIAEDIAEKNPQQHFRELLMLPPDLDKGLNIRRPQAGLSAPWSGSDAEGPLTRRPSGFGLQPGFEDFNLQHLSADETAVSEVLEHAMTMPFMGPPRVVIVRGVDRYPAEELQKLLPYLESPNDSTCLVLVADKPDWRLKLFKAARQQGCEVF
jgi:outer membrane lipopolysaccharide assembly protein LptE/RlpB